MVDDAKNLKNAGVREKRAGALQCAQTDEQLKNAVRGRFYRPVKQQITARVDADVLEWLKSQGKGYQARMNAILRREMLISMSKQNRA